MCVCVCVCVTNAYKHSKYMYTHTQAHASTCKYTCTHKQITELNRQEQEKHEAAAQSKSSTQDSASSSQSKLSSDWTPEEVQLLVKAVTMYPAGTIKRWETIAGFVNSHSSDGCVEKTAKMVIAKVKTLKKVESSDKETQNKMAFARFEQQHVIKEKKKGAGVATEATPT